MTALPLQEPRASISKPTSKRKRSSSSCPELPMPIRKQIKSNPTTKDVEQRNSICSVEISAKNDTDPSLRSVLEAHLNTSLDSWLGSLEKLAIISRQPQQLKPSNTYIYMQTDPLDPSSYLLAPLPRSAVPDSQQIPTPHSSPDPPEIWNSKISSPSPYLQLQVQVQTQMQTPPTTPILNSNCSKAFTTESITPALSPST